MQKQPSQSQIKRLLKVLKVILFTRMPLTLLGLIIIVALSIFVFNYSIFAFNYLKPETTPTGQAVLEEQKCPECVCEEEECEQDCELCPVKTQLETKNIIYYQCPGGALVENLDDCEKNLPNVSEEYSGTVEGITLSIDNIEYESESNNTGYVTRVDYTIINKGKKHIVPQIQVKVYKEWSMKVKAATANKIIDPEIVINPKDYVKRKDRARIYFQGEKQIVRLLLVDTLPDPDKEVISVTREFRVD